MQDSEIIKTEIKMINKNQIAAISTATLFISAIPAYAVASSASLTLSNINITATQLDSKPWLFKWDYENLPTVPFGAPDRDEILILAQTYYSIYSGDSPNYLLYTDTDGDAISGMSARFQEPYLSAISSVPFAASSGEISTNPDTRFTQPEFINLSAETTPVPYDHSFWYEGNILTESYKYFHGKGPVEFNISADYFLSADPGDNTYLSSSSAGIQLISNINGISHLLFGKEFAFESDKSPGLHTESGTISLKFIEYGTALDNTLDGYFRWSTYADAATSFIVYEVPEPSTYAMLLAGLGFLGIGGIRNAVINKAAIA